MHNLFMADHAGRLHYRIALLVHPKHRTLAEDALRCCAYDLHLWLRERQTRPADGNPALLLLEANFDARPGRQRKSCKNCAHTVMYFQSR